MLLSEAIRLGAMWKPQGRKALLKNGRTCALGAGLDAIGQFGTRSESICGDYHDACRRWPFLLRLMPCPSGHDYGECFNIITHLNDHHGWTREQIADWVATIEPREQSEDSAAINHQPDRETV